MTETGASREATTRSKRTVPSGAGFVVAPTRSHVEPSVSVTASDADGSASAGASGDGARRTIRKPSPPAVDAQSRPRDRSRRSIVMTRPSSAYRRPVEMRVLPTLHVRSSAPSVPELAAGARPAVSAASAAAAARAILPGKVLGRAVMRLPPSRRPRGGASSHQTRGRGSRITQGTEMNQMWRRNLCDKPHKRRTRRRLSGSDEGGGTSSGFPQKTSARGP